MVLWPPLVATLKKSRKRAVQMIKMLKQHLLEKGHITWWVWSKEEDWRREQGADWAVCSKFQIGTCLPPSTSSRWSRCRRMSSFWGLSEKLLEDCWTKRAWLSWFSFPPSGNLWGFPVDVVSRVPSGTDTGWSAKRKAPIPAKQLQPGALPLRQLSTWVSGLLLVFFCASCFMKGFCCYGNARVMNMKKSGFVMMEKAGLVGKFGAQKSNRGKWGCKPRSDR